MLGRAPAPLPASGFVARAPPFGVRANFVGGAFDGEEEEPSGPVLPVAGLCWPGFGSRALLAVIWKLGFDHWASITRLRTQRTLEETPASYPAAQRAGRRAAHAEKLADC